MGSLDRFVLGDDFVGSLVDLENGQSAVDLFLGGSEVLAEVLLQDFVGDGLDFRRSLGLVDFGKFVVFGLDSLGEQFLSLRRHSLNLLDDGVNVLTGGQFLEFFNLLHDSLILIVSIRLIVLSLIV